MQQDKTQVLRRLEELYAKIPRVSSRRGCSRCSDCCGPVIWSRIEWERIPEERRKNQTTINCPYIGRDHRCEIYDIRPLACRLFGVVQKMRCPYGGQDTFLTQGEEDAILKEYQEILRY